MGKGGDAVDTYISNWLPWCSDHFIIIKEFRCYEAKIEESEKGRQPPGVEPGIQYHLCSTYRGL